MALNPKQRRFVSEYLKDSNATQAATRAGYSAKSAHAQGCRLLKDAEVCAAVANRSEKVAMSADDILRELAGIAQNGAKDSDRVAALGLLGKNLKLFTDKLEHAGVLGFTLEQLVPKRKPPSEGK